MLSITYSSAYDPYHCVFRALQLRLLRGRSETELIRLQFIDFYYVFPTLFKDVRKTQETRRRYEYLKRLDLIPEPYASLPSPRSLFHRVREVQQAAFAALSSQGFVLAKPFKDGLVQWTDKELSGELGSAIAAATQRDDVILRLLTDFFFVLPLRGPDGLKARTGLVGFRHDLPEA